nr:pentapeptide repeat-containing protein [Chlorobaculum sp. 24CR]
MISTPSQINRIGIIVALLTGALALYGTAVTISDIPNSLEWLKNISFITAIIALSSMTGALWLSVEGHKKPRSGIIMLIVATLGFPLSLGLQVDGEFLEQLLIACQPSEKYSSTMVSRIFIPGKRILNLQEQLLFANHPDPEIVAQLRSSEWTKALQKIEPINLQGRSLRHANFENAILCGADLRNTELQGANFRQAWLLSADLSKAQLRGANLLGANLQGAALFETQLNSSGLLHTQLQGAYLRFAQLRGANLFNAQLQSANLGAVQLQSADLTEANLQGTYLSDAQLQGANLSNADLRGADLFGAELQEANLTGTNLQGANLAITQLQGADLSEAKLQGANLREANIYGVIMKKNTTELIDAIKLTWKNELKSTPLLNAIKPHLPLSVNIDVASSRGGELWVIHMP